MSLWKINLLVRDFHLQPADENVFWIKMHHKVIQKMYCSEVALWNDVSVNLHICNHAFWADVKIHRSLTKSKWLRPLQNISVSGSSFQIHELWRLYTQACPDTTVRATAFFYSSQHPLLLVCWFSFFPLPLYLRNTRPIFKSLRALTTGS